MIRSQAPHGGEEAGPRLNSKSTAVALGTLASLLFFLVLRVAASSGGFFGNAHARPPEIDALASAGMRPTYACLDDGLNASRTSWRHAELIRTGRVWNTECDCARDETTFFCGRPPSHSVVVAFRNNSPDDLWPVEREPGRRPLMDQDFRLLARFPDLRRLLVEDEPAVTDQGVQVVESLPQLERLFLEKVSITDRSIASIVKCSKLQHLSLASDALTDAGAAQLASLRDLKYLYLESKAVTGEFLKSFYDRGVGRIELFCPNVSDETLDAARDVIGSAKLIRRKWSYRSLRR